MFWIEEAIHHHSNSRSLSLIPPTTREKIKKYTIHSTLSEHGGETRRFLFLRKREREREREMRLITLLGCLLFSSVLVVNGVSLRTDKSGMLLESSRFRILGKSIATSRDNRFDFFFVE